MFIVSESFQKPQSTFPSQKEFKATTMKKVHENNISNKNICEIT